MLGLSVPMKVRHQQASMEKSSAAVPIANLASDWPTFPDDRLLEMKLSDLRLSLRGSRLEPLIVKVQRELVRRGIQFTPHFWLSSEWFTPDGVPGIAVPFYLVHPRLQELERRQMRGLEMENAQLSLRILRHEIGHAIENAYGLRRLACVQEVFGPSTKTYPTTYSPKIFSRRYVQNLSDGYGQSHPDEDFAETFAVWLTPRRQWKHRYKHWPALKKLEFMDWLMRTYVIRQKPKLTNTRTVDPLWRLRKTLRAHYCRERRRFGLSGSTQFDRSLKRLFSTPLAPRVGMTADLFLRKIKKELIEEVAWESKKPRYVVEHAVGEMICRARELNLHSPMARPSKRAFRSLSPILKAQLLRYVRSRSHRIAI